MQASATRLLAALRTSAGAFPEWAIVAAICTEVEAAVDGAEEIGSLLRGPAMHEDDRRGVQLQRPAHHLAGIDRGVVDGAGAASDEYSHNLVILSLG